jgi:V8-like Glu-specific endopeptidase
MAQMERPPQQDLPFNIDSGKMTNATLQTKVVFSKMVQVPTATWMRVWFDQANLPTGSHLRITGQRNGWVQILDSESLPRYFDKSCFFGGDTVLVELVAGPDTKENRIRVSGVTAGLPNKETICGSTDNRALSYDDRQGRLMPVGCTGWMISPDVMLTAGHCFASSTSQILSFKVPLSNSSGVVQPSHPDDQYPTIPSTAKFLNGGIGADWSISRVGPNSNTTLRPGDAYGMWYTLGSVPSSTSGQSIRVTGYGTTSSPVSPTWNQVQKTHTGPLYGITSTALRYQTDTTGGNSGSPLYHTNTGYVIGIHTHGGCSTSSTSYNSGTRIDRSDLQTEIARLMLPVTSKSYFVPNSSASTGTCNVIPFGQNTVSTTWSNQKYQCLIYRSDIGYVSSATIRNLAFAPCVSGMRHFDTILIRMAQTNQNTLSTTFASNLDYNVRTVLSKRDYDWENTADTWNRIGLDYDYPYNSATASNIVIEITVTGAVLNTSSTAFPGFHTDARERVYAYGWTSTPTTGSSSSTSALKVEVCTTAYDLHHFGLACVGSNRRYPDLTLSGSGALGGRLNLTLQGALANANAFLVLNAYRYYQPLDLKMFGAPNCRMYMSDLVLAGVKCDALGVHKLSLTIPKTTRIGERVYLQYFPFDLKANDLHLTASNYGMVLVGN